MVLTISREPSLFFTQPGPAAAEVWWRAEVENFSLKSSKDPKALLMASARGATGFAAGHWGAMQLK